MRDKVIGLETVVGCRAIRVQRKEGRKYITVREFAPTAGAAAWSCAEEDAGGRGGIYRFAATDDAGDTVASHRADMPQDEQPMTDSEAFVRYLTGQNNQLMTILGSIMETQAQSLTGGKNAADQQRQEPDVMGMLGSMVGAYGATSSDTAAQLEAALKEVTELKSLLSGGGETTGEGQSKTLGKGQEADK